MGAKLVSFLQQIVTRVYYISILSNFILAKYQKSNVFIQSPRLRELTSFEHLLREIPNMCRFVVTYRQTRIEAVVLV